VSASADIKKIIERLKKDVQKQFSAKEMQKIGNFVVEEIKGRSRKGYGVAKLGGEEEAFDSLSPDYIARRRKSKLSPFTKPSKSNITFSGKLLGGLRYKARDGYVRIEPTGLSRDGKSNLEVAQHVSETRPFMTLSKYQLGRLYEFIKNKISTITD